MINKTFGEFEGEAGEIEGGSVQAAETPPILGAPMPNAGMKNKTLGSVFPEKDDPTPKQFMGRRAAAKRMKAMPNTSPLGPVSSMPMRSRRPVPGQQPMGQSPVGVGDRWMGELWQGLTLDDQPQGGYAMGGSVQSDMDLYNKTISDLEGGGLAGYAGGGMVDMSRKVASKGRHGDTMLMHVNPGELGGLQSLLGPVTVNPETGNPEAWVWALPLIGAALGTGIGAIADGKDGALKGLAIGSMVGLGGAGIAGAAAPASGGILSATGASAGIQGPLTHGATALGAQTLGQSAAMGVPSGISAVKMAGAGAAPTIAAKGGVTLPQVAKGLSTGLSALSSTQQSPTPTPPPAPVASNSPRRRMAPGASIETPIDRIKRRSGLGSLPGSGSIV